MLVSLTGAQIALISDLIDHAEGKTVLFDAAELALMREMRSELADALHPGARRVPSGVVDTDDCVRDDDGRTHCL